MPRNATRGAKEHQAQNVEEKRQKQGNQRACTSHANPRIVVRFDRYMGTYHRSCAHRGRRIPLQIAQFLRKNVAMTRVSTTSNNHDKPQAWCHDVASHVAFRLHHVVAPPRSLASFRTREAPRAFVVETTDPRRRALLPPSRTLLRLFLLSLFLASALARFLRVRLVVHHVRVRVHVLPSVAPSCTHLGDALRGHDACDVHRWRMLPRTMDATDNRGGRKDATRRGRATDGGDGSEERGASSTGEGNVGGSRWRGKRHGRLLEKPGKRGRPSR